MYLLDRLKSFYTVRYFTQYTLSTKRCIRIVYYLVYTIHYAVYSIHCRAGNIQYNCIVYTVTVYCMCIA